MNALIFGPKKQQQTRSHPFHNQAPKTLSCPPAQTQHECIAQQAMEAARLGNVQDVSTICQNESSSLAWRVLLFSSRSARSAQASPWVLRCHRARQAADPFIENCHNHLILELAQLAPSSYTSKKQDWQVVLLQLMPLAQPGVERSTSCSKSKRSTVV